MSDLGDLSQAEREIAARVQLEEDLLFEDDAELVVGGKRLPLLLRVYGRFVAGVPATRDDEGQVDGFEIERVVIGDGADARDVTAVVMDDFDTFDELVRDNI